MDEKKILEAIAKTLDRPYWKKQMAQEILTAIKAELPEPLEVEIRENLATGKWSFHIDKYVYSKEQAIDFCTKHGLRVKND